MLYDKKITASSIWVDEESGLICERNLPEKATNRFPNDRWRASVQKEVYDGSDWIEVNLNVPQKIGYIINVVQFI